MHFKTNSAKMCQWNVLLSSSRATFIVKLNLLPATKSGQVQQEKVIPLKHHLLLFLFHESECVIVRKIDRYSLPRDLLKSICDEICALLHNVCQYTC